MKNQITIFLILCVLSCLRQGESFQSKFNSANQAFDDGNYDQALELYEDIAEFNDPKIYQNIANCYYRKNNIARAILYFEKSKKWGGNHKDLDYNLGLCRSLLKDELKAAPELIVWKYWKRASQNLSSNKWSLLGLLLLFMGVICLLMNFRKSQSNLITRLCLFALLLGFLCYCLAVTKYRLETKSTEGILLKPSVTVKSEPTVGSKDLFIIHEGIKLKIRDNQSDWMEIEIPDGRQGWVKANMLETI